MTLADAILFADAEALVLDKPAGLPVDAPRAGGRSVAGLAADLKFGFVRAPVAVHRLDRDTSGCLLLARNQRALKRFQAGFADRAVTKTYLAIVGGRPSGDAGVIDLALAKVSAAATGWRMVPDAEGQPAETGWQWLASVGKTSLLRLTPTTGRTHQLRVHLAEGLGCPIIGDPVYGTNDARGMMLHAAQLIVPRLNKPAIIAHAPFPARFVAMGYGDPDG